MDKKGFTLVELLVVIAIIGILSVIIVPSVININNNFNKRMLDQKQVNIETAAETYASDNADIFNGVEEVYVYVWELINYGYVNADIDKNDTRCVIKAAEHSVKGCVLDPTASGDNVTLNDDYVILRKQGVGYTAKYVHNEVTPDGSTITDNTLVGAVCEAYANGKLNGRTTDGKDCYCYNDSGNKVGAGATVLKDSDGRTLTEGEACIIAGENPNNYLRYGDSKPNWRVLGIYNIDGTLTAKMITSEPI